MADLDTKAMAVSSPDVANDHPLAVRGTGVGATLVKVNMQSAINGSALAAQVTALSATVTSLVGDVVTISDAAANLLAAHHNDILYLTDASPVLTVLPQASEAYVDDQTVVIAADDAFQIVGGAGVTINGAVAPTYDCQAAPGSVALLRTAENTWLLLGAASEA